MSGDKINNKPNPWGIVHDYSKTVISLATGFLALTVTFSGHLLGKQNPPWLIYILIVCWILLVISIFSGLLVAVFLSEYLRDKKKSLFYIFSSNVAFFTLVGAVIAFLIFGIGQIKGHDRGLDAATAVKQMLDTAPNLYRNVNGYWEVESLIWDDSTEEWKTVISFSFFSMELKVKNKYSVVIDAKRRKIIKFSKINSGVDNS